MNIYIEVEILKRELAGKLLIALELLKYDHQVYIADRGMITRSAINKKIKPGVIFLKDMNSQKYRISDYKKIIKNGFKIVSQDEEIGCFTNNSFKEFYNGRFKGSNVFKYIDKYFCWGDFDYNFLKKIKLKTKFCKAGSPRIDISKKIKSKKNINFKKKHKIKKRIILVSLNHNLFWKRDLIERFSIEIEGVKKNKINLIANQIFKSESKDLIMLNHLFELIVELDKLNQYSIILRPHPVMDVNKVKSLVKNYNFLKNVKIIGEDDLIDHINCSDFVIHNGCTSSVEATLNSKNVICYYPNNQYLSDYRSHMFINKLGKRFSHISKIVGYIKKNSNKNFRQINIINNDIHKINKRVITDCLSFKRISKEINSIKPGKYNYNYEGFKSKKINFFFNLKQIIKKTLIKYNLKTNTLSVLDLKFPPFQKKEISKQLNNLNDEFNINAKYSLDLINLRCLKIYKSQN